MTTNDSAGLPRSDEVQVGALRSRSPRPLVRGADGATEALPPVGRPPKRRYRRAVGLGLGALAIVALSGRFAFQQWDRHRLHSGGPVTIESPIQGRNLRVGDQATFRAVALVNAGRTPAVLEDLRVVGVTDGFEVLDVRAESSIDDTIGAPLVDRHTVGAVSSPSTVPNESGNRLRIAVTARATQPGAGRAKGLEITYRVGRRRYRRFDAGSMYLCAPPEDFAERSCVGHDETPFSSAIVDFPVR